MMGHAMGQCVKEDQGVNAAIRSTDGYAHWRTVMPGNIPRALPQDTTFTNGETKMKPIQPTTQTKFTADDRRRAAEKVTVHRKRIIETLDKTEFGEMLAKRIRGN